MSSAKRKMSEKRKKGKDENEDSATQDNSMHPLASLHKEVTDRTWTAVLFILSLHRNVRHTHTHT